MPDIAWNKAVWGRDYAWPKDGDEWSQFAEFCGVDYGKWKESLARTFLIPYVKENSVVVEIGPGHGRWTEYTHSRVSSSGQIHLVDLSQNCIEFCRERFGSGPVFFHTNDGRTLPPVIAPGSVDLIWSFDTFVHIEESEVRSYAREFFRALKTHGTGVIHHAGAPTPEQRAGGARSLVSSRLFWQILTDAGFFVIRQASEWGDGCNLKLTGDTISVFTKP